MRLIKSKNGLTDEESWSRLADLSKEYLERFLSRQDLDEDARAYTISMAHAALCRLYSLWLCEKGRDDRPKSATKKYPISSL